MKALIIIVFIAFHVMPFVNNGRGINPLNIENPIAIVKER